MTQAESAPDPLILFIPIDPLILFIPIDPLILFELTLRPPI
jgi:hypothetical protein